jgi:hypothetical protein
LEAVEFCNLSSLRRNFQHASHLTKEQAASSLHVWLFHLVRSLVTNDHSL